MSRDDAKRTLAQLSHAIKVIRESPGDSTRTYRQKGDHFSFDVPGTAILKSAAESVRIH